MTCIQKLSFCIIFHCNFLLDRGKKKRPGKCHEHLHFAAGWKLTPVPHPHLQIPSIPTILLRAETRATDCGAAS